MYVKFTGIRSCWIKKSTQILNYGIRVEIDATLIFKRQASTRVAYVHVKVALDMSKKQMLRRDAVAGIHFMARNVLS